MFHLNYGRDPQSLPYEPADFRKVCAHNPDNHRKECGTRKVSTELTDYRKLVSELKELASSYERRTEVYKDSLMMMRGLMEKSSNITDSVSHLETSYAKSDASVRGGKLFHSIENKDSIPGQVRFVFINVERHDTLWRERTDSATVEKKEKTRMVMEKKRFGEVFFYTSGMDYCCGWCRDMVQV